MDGWDRDLSIPPSFYSFLRHGEGGPDGMDWETGEGREVEKEEKGWIGREHSPQNRFFTDSEWQ